MMFGRVEGLVRRDVADPAAIHLTVTLEAGASFTVVRDEPVGVLRPIHGDADLIWHADQYTQETLGTQLAEEGWEVIGAGDLPTDAEDGLARSARYAVRRL